MKSRLGIFVFTLLILPLAGLWLSDSQWYALTTDTPAAITNPPATLLTTLMMAGYVFLINHIINLLTGNNPLKSQRAYMLWMAAAGAILVWLLVYLNLYVANWTTQPQNQVLQLLLYTPLFATLAPAVLSTRTLLGSVPGVLKYLSRCIALPTLKNETLIFSMTAMIVTGLLGGVAWPDQLFWLLWLSPLLLLTTLQLLWHESTIFDGLARGDWGRIIFACLSGIVVSNFLIFTYQTNGGVIRIDLPNLLLAQLGFAVFGMLCLQLGDVIAENWRGKQRGEMFRKKKNFSIPIVVKKN